MRSARILTTELSGGSPSESQCWVAHSENMVISTSPGKRKYNRRGGRPPLDVDFVAVCVAVQEAWNGSGETITEIAERFGVSRGWIWKWVYLELGGVRR